jgi:tetratricopeptide (TPR) repeat protein
MRHLVVLLWGLSAPVVVPAQTSPDALIEAGHGKRARAIVEARYAANPNDPDTLRLMSWVKQEQGDLAAATQFAEKAVAAAPKDPRCHFRLADATGEEAQKAGMLKQVGLGRKFKKEIDTVLALNPKHTGALNYLMEFYLHAPGIVGGDKKKAAEIPGQIAAVDPVKGVFAEIELARFDKQTDRLPGLYRKAVELQPGSYDARVSLGNFLINADLKDAPEAEKQAREALKIDATRIGAHGLLAVSLAVQERWNEVDAALAQAEKDVPDNLQPYLRVANWCINKGVDLPRAERYVRKYLSQDPELGFPSHATARWRLGLALEKMGRKSEAIAEYQASVKMDGNSPAKNELKRLKA